MLQLCKLSNTGSKPTCLVLWTILKHDQTSHLATARASDSVIYSDIARVISLRIIIIITIIIGTNYLLLFQRYDDLLVENLCFSPLLPSAVKTTSSCGYCALPLLTTTIILTGFLLFLSHFAEIDYSLYQKLLISGQTYWSYLIM